MIITLFLISIASVWNQPLVGAVTESTAVILIGLDESDSTRAIYSLDVNYGTTSDTAYGKFNKMTLNSLVADTFYHYKVIVWRGATVDTTVGRTFRTQDTSGTFEFAVMGDPHIGEYGDSSSAFDSLLQQLRKDGADFLIILGDNIYANAVSSPFKVARFDTLYHSLHTRIDSMVDSTMVLGVIGNHDIGSLTGEVYTQPQMDSAIKAYNNTFISYPALDSGYYWWRWGECAFVISNDEWLSWGDFGITQTNYLRDVLNDSITAESFNWKFFCCHIPLNYENCAFRDSVRRWLADNEVNFSFSGHIHHYNNQGYKSGTKSIFSGGAGAKITPVEQRYSYSGGQLYVYHYILFNIYPDSIKGYVKSTGGDTLALIEVYKTIKKPNKILGGKIKL